MDTNGKLLRRINGLIGFGRDLVIGTPSRKWPTGYREMADDFNDVQTEAEAMLEALAQTVDPPIRCECLENGKACTCQTGDDDL